MSQLENRVRAKIAKRSAAIGYTDGGSAELGKLDSSGNWIADVSEGLTSPFVWITWDRTQVLDPATNTYKSVARKVDRAYNSKVSTRLAGVQVIVKEIAGFGWVVTGLDPVRASETLKDDAPSFDQPDRKTEHDVTPVTNSRLIAGSVRLSENGGLEVWVEAFTYPGGQFDGGAITLTPTATSGKRALIKIYYDPVAQSLKQVLGSDQPATYAITEATRPDVLADAIAIPVTDIHIPLTAALLANETTEVTLADLIDLRPQLQPITAPATLQTTDATTTTLVSIPVAEQTAIRVSGQVLGTKDDYSATAGRGFAITARRATGGDVTLVGAAQYDAAIQEDSSGTPSITADVDTGTQTVRVRIAGIAAEDWNWKTVYEIVRLTG